MDQPKTPERAMTPRGAMIAFLAAQMAQAETLTPLWVVGVTDDGHLGLLVAEGVRRYLNEDAVRQAWARREGMRLMEKLCPESPEEEIR